LLGQIVFAVAVLKPSCCVAKPPR